MVWKFQPHCLGVYVLNRGYWGRVPQGCVTCIIDEGVMS